MKRHAQLQPFSRAHHQTLRLARILKYSEPDLIDLRRSLDQAHPALTEHFADEESEFSELARRLPEDHPLIGLLAQMISEHIVIKAEVFALLGRQEACELTSYKALGARLAEHVAFEERVLFPRLEQCCLSSEQPTAVIS